MTMKISSRLTIPVLRLTPALRQENPFAPNNKQPRPLSRAALPSNPFFLLSHFHFASLSALHLDTFVSRPTGSEEKKKFETGQPTMFPALSTPACNFRWHASVFQICYPAPFRMEGMFRERRGGKKAHASIRMPAGNSALCVRCLALPFSRDEHTCPFSSPLCVCEWVPVCTGIAATPWVGSG